MIRTVWLGLVLLVGLVALASFKLAFGSPRPVAAAEIAAVSSIQGTATVGTNATPDTLTKGDRLQVTYVPAVAPVAAAAPVPSESPAAVAPKIISRHWHDPSDQKVHQVPARKSKREDSKKRLAVVERKPVLEADACKSDGLDQLRRIFNSAASCSTSR